jgi:hypothetical protein
MIGIENKPDCYAVHQVRDGWEVIAPSDDPYRPAYGRVDVIRRYGWHAAGRDRGGQAPLSWDAECNHQARRPGRVRCANRLSAVK